MAKTIGEVVDKFRVDNRYSVKRLTEDIISYAAYYRFVHDNANISTDRFLALLERLDVSVDEINTAVDEEYISPNQFIANYLHISTGDKFNFSELQILNDLVTKRYEISNSTRCLHYIWITQCSLDRWQNVAPKYQTELLKFFDKRENWSEANLVLFALTSTSLPFIFITRSFGKVTTQYEQRLSSRQIEESYFRFLINTCLQCINHQSQFLFKQAAAKLHKFNNINGSLDVSIYRQFIIDLAAWEQNPSHFNLNHFNSAASLLRSFHQGLLADQIINYAKLFEETNIKGHSRSVTKPFIPVL